MASIPPDLHFRITDKKSELVMQETTFSNGRFETTTTIRTTGRMKLVSGKQSKPARLGVAIGKRRV